MKQAVAYLNLQDVPAAGVGYQDVVSVATDNAVAADSLWVLAVSFKDNVWVAETKSMTAVKGREHADIFLATEGLLEVLLKVSNIPRQARIDARNLRQTLLTLLNHDLDPPE